MTTPALILASGSPRRSELLGRMGVLFDVMTADVKELNGEAHLAPADLAIENARLKAAAVAAHPDAKGRWVLGADTVVTMHNKFYGKPKSIDEARKFLRKFRGRTHEVITGGVLLNPSREDRIFYDVSRVTFRDFTDKVVDKYLAEVEVLDKAGGYALQLQGEWLVDRVNGSESNVIGLPVEVVERMLKSCGLL